MRHQNVAVRWVLVRYMKHQPLRGRFLTLHFLMAPNVFSIYRTKRSTEGEYSCSRIQFHSWLIGNCSRTLCCMSTQSVGEQLAENGYVACQLNFHTPPCHPQSSMVFGIDDHIDAAVARTSMQFRYCPWAVSPEPRNPIPGKWIAGRKSGQVSAGCGIRTINGLTKTVIAEDIKQPIPPTISSRSRPTCQSNGKRELKRDLPSRNLSPC